MEYGEILIDNEDNYLLYGDDAVIVNVSAFSIKKLYAEHSISLLARNLRYYIKKGTNEKRVDDGISKTIEESPETFWLKNNGLTIICDDFQIVKREVKLSNFSIVNGGQTTYMISQSESIDSRHDLWLPCKIIKIKGETENQKKDFVLDIAEATNSQKPINEEDLKANSPEQIRFAKAMLKVGVFYQNKRGERPPSEYRAVYRRTKMSDIGKWCLAAIFQEPSKSRADPKTYFDKKYYDVIFNGNQEQIADICKELIYIDYYFEKKFKPKFKQDNEDKLNSANRIKIATIAERFCLAFVTLAARFHQSNITEKDLSTLTDENADSDIVNKMLSELGEMNSLIPIEIDTEGYNTALDKLFTAIINAGAKFYSRECRNKPSVKLTNLIKTDKFYYAILKDYWDDLEPAIEEAFKSMLEA